MFGGIVAHNTSLQQSGANDELAPQAVQAGLWDGYFTWAAAVTDRARAAIDRWAQKTEEDLCSAGVSLLLPASFDATEEGDVGDVQGQSEGQIEGSKRNDSEEQFLVHFSDSFEKNKVAHQRNSVRATAISILTTLAKSSGGMKKEANATPNVTWLADTVISANRSSDFGDKSLGNQFIDSHATISFPSESIGFWPSLIRPAYAAGEGEGSGGGCGAKPVIDAAARVAKAAVQPPVVTIAEALGGGEETFLIKPEDIETTYLSSYPLSRSPAEKQAVALAIARDLTLHSPTDVSETIVEKAMVRLREMLFAKTVDDRAPPWDSLAPIISVAYRQAANTITSAQQTAPSEAAPATRGEPAESTKKSPLGDYLVSITRSLNSRLDNLIRTLPWLRTFVTGRPGLSSRPSEPTRSTPLLSIPQRLAGPWDSYVAWADGVTARAQEGINVLGREAEERLCGAGASLLPAGSAGSAVRPLGADDDVGKQEDENHEKRIGDSRIGQKVLNLDSAYHSDLLLSDTQSPINNPTIPNRRFFVNSIRDAVNEVVVKPGAISTTPNQPEERLNSIADSPSRRVLREQSITIGSKSSTRERNVSTDHGFFLIRPAYAATNQGGGGAARRG